MIESILNIASKHGPFPAGLVIGGVMVFIIMRWSISQQLHYMQREKDGLRKEKENLHDFIKTQQKRIDALHAKLLPDQ